MSFDPDAPAGANSLFGLPFTPEDARVVVLPVPWQATTSYRRGTKDGPAGVLLASRQVDLHDLELGDAWRAGYAMLPEPDEVRAWDDAAEMDALAVIAAIEGGEEVPDDALARVNALSEQVNGFVLEAVRDLYAQGKIPAVLGGDHSVPFGAIQAASERFPGLGVLHIDAHADLREAYEGFTWSHASIFHNVLSRLPDVAVVAQVGLRDVGEREVEFAQAQGERVHWCTDREMQQALAEGTPWMALVREIVAHLPEHVWVSFDVDGLDPALCPNTGTPVPGGLTWGQAGVLLAELARSRHIVGFDLNEVGPGEWDGNVGARLLFKLCGLSVTCAPPS